MTINGKVHCFFEQSGTFKKEFIKLGIPAEDYDIQNNFGETDHTDDLFREIEKAYDGDPSIFDIMSCDDLIIAFFPCIYFCELSQMAMYFGSRNYRKLSIKEKTEKNLERSKNREYFFSVAVKMFSVVIQKGLRMIMENPWSMQTFLKANFVMAPSLIDKDRTRRGDYFVKPTAYWYVNCEPTTGQSFQKPLYRKNVLEAKQGLHAGLCSEERSMISPDYARNFICDFIIGKEQKINQLSLFNQQ